MIEIIFIVDQMMSGKGLKKCEFLKPFYVMNNFISGSSYPTSNRYFMQVWKIECLLWENAKSDDPTIKDMSLSMMNKFSKYWDHYCNILVIGAILDPWIKFEAIRFCYSKIDPSTCEEKINVLKDNIDEAWWRHGAPSAAEMMEEAWKSGRQVCRLLLAMDR